MPKAARFFCRFLSVIIALALVLGAGAFAGFTYLNTAPEGNVALLRPVIDGMASSGAMRLTDDNALIFEVRAGESAHSVGTRLQTAGVIRNRYFWNTLFRFDNEHVRTGTYRIELPATQVRIRSILTSGEQLLVRVTIPEGSTIRRAARLIEEAGITSFDDFVNAAYSREILETFNVLGASMEGFLFPDTYLFPLGYPAHRVVTAMAENFARRLEELDIEMSGAVSALTREELNNRVILASIVEREHRLASEASVMAGVFYNRLRIGMPLQSCATVEYVITEIMGLPHPQRLFYRDLEIPNPFNTYMHRGLPPGPISAPGRVSLKAAIEPASTNYLFFRLIDASTGRHHFSRTFDEHNRAGAFFVRGS